MSRSFKINSYRDRYQTKLSGTPRENRAKKKVDFRFFYFFFIYMKDQVKKSLSLVGNKIKSFILIDIGETRKKRFLDLF